jgi:hypothetical protein
MDDPLDAFLNGELPLLCVEADGTMGSQSPRSRLLIPGAFNPIHDGHLGLARVAEQLIGDPAAFELSIANVDKPLTDADIRQRLPQFSGRAPVWLTRAPTFLDKAKLFPGAVFVIGADTAVRIVAPRYYADSIETMRRALTTVRELGCRFLVAGRADSSGAFAHVDTLPIPSEHRELFEAIPEELFRVDVSSTTLRGNPRCGTVS